LDEETNSGIYIMHSMPGYPSVPSTGINAGKIDYNIPLT